MPKQKKQKGIEAWIKEEIMDNGKMPTLTEIFNFEPHFNYTNPAKYIEVLITPLPSKEDITPTQKRGKK